MKANIIGIIAAIIAFVSIVLPWWTITVSAGGEIPLSLSISIYLYQVSGTGIAITANAWYMWVALAFVVLGGVFGIVGSITSLGKKMLLGGAIFALLSLVIFAVGLQMDFSSAGAPFGLFGSGSIYGATWSAYLSFGFWLALVAAILTFVAYMKHPTETVAAPPPSA